MPELKTQKNKESVERFLKTIKDKDKLKDCLAISKMMSAATKDKGSMYGTAIVGFGTMKIKYANGKEKVILHNRVGIVSQDLLSDRNLKGGGIGHRLQEL